ncbi:hypothetical protein, partial [Serratia marcescens]|uniref:hypothetical protein n=1 Tax=Serratia marcescens TaxID=615 RepID=UPI001E3D7D9B
MIHFTLLAYFGLTNSFNRPTSLHWSQFFIAGATLSMWQKTGLLTWRKWPASCLTRFGDEMKTIANTPLPGAVRQPGYDRRALRS